jgi:hypothetical protein
VEERRGSAESHLSRAARWRMSSESGCAWSVGSLDGAQVGIVENRRTDIHHTRAGHQRGASGQEALDGGAFESLSCWAEWYTSLKKPTCGSYRRVRFARVLSVISGYGILVRVGDLEGGVSDARG